MATYSYTGPNSDMEKVRLRIGDTSGAAATSIFSDEEIAYFLTTAGSVILSAIMALRTCMASRVLMAKKAKIEGYEVEEFTAKDLQLMVDALISESTGGLEVGSLSTTGEDIDSYLPTWTPDDDTGIGTIY